MEKISHKQIVAIPRPESLLAIPAGAIRAPAGASARTVGRMLIGMAQIRRTWASMHRLRESHQPVIANRIKYLIKAGFPRRSDAQPGGRTKMGIDDALKMLFALELQALGVSTVFATATINGNWTILREALLKAWQTRGTVDPENPDIVAIERIAGAGTDTEAAPTPRGAPTDRRKKPGTEPEMEAAEVGVQVRLMTRAQFVDEHAQRRLAPTLLFVDATVLIATIEEGLHEALVATPKTFRTEMELLAADVLATAEMQG